MSIIEVVLHHGHCNWGIVDKIDNIWGCTIIISDYYRILNIFHRFHHNVEIHQSLGPLEV